MYRVGELGFTEAGKVPKMFTPTATEEMKKELTLVLRGALMQYARASLGLSFFTCDMRMSVMTLGPDRMRLFTVGTELCFGIHVS